MITTPRPQHQNQPQSTAAAARTQPVSVWSSPPPSLADRREATTKNWKRLLPLILGDNNSSNASSTNTADKDPALVNRKYRQSERQFHFRRDVRRAGMTLFSLMEEGRGEDGDTSTEASSVHHSSTMSNVCLSEAAASSTARVYEREYDHDDNSSISTFDSKRSHNEPSHTNSHTNHTEEKEEEDTPTNKTTLWEQWTSSRKCQILLLLVVLKIVVGCVVGGVVLFLLSKGSTPTNPPPLLLANGTLLNQSDGQFDALFANSTPSAAPSSEVVILRDSITIEICTNRSVDKSGYVELQFTGLPPRVLLDNTTVGLLEKVFKDTYNNITGKW